MELFINAIEHGNLEIDATLKKDLIKEQKWLDEIHRRMEMPNFSNRKVNVIIHQDDAYYLIDIIDGGHGFDWVSVFDALNINHQTQSGRGILMAQLISFDKIEYLFQGNHVRAYLKKL
jgi:hypothetical protein